jgi:hypothetical protein
LAEGVIDTHGFSVYVSDWPRKRLKRQRAV